MARHYRHRTFSSSHSVRPNRAGQGKGIDSDDADFTMMVLGDVARWTAVWTVGVMGWRSLTLKGGVNSGYGL